jgi:hypothetical protein
MTPSQFIARWRDNPLSERAGSQAFFLDLCALLGVEAPNDPDDYCFERGATRTGAGHGWADVWKRGHFGWENKGPGGDLGSALKQLMTYALALDNPPLLVVSNRDVTRSTRISPAGRRRRTPSASKTSARRRTCKSCAGCSPTPRSSGRVARCRKSPPTPPAASPTSPNR